MNTVSLLPPGISLRAIREGDASFLSRLYASTREEEMAVVPWDQAQKDQFLQQQFEAQHQFYQEHFAGARFDLILKNDRAIGRLYVARQPDEIRVIDIALLPGYRGQGLGGGLIKGLIAEAASEKKPVRIHVETFNPALRFYERLGFRKLEDKGVYWSMEWRAP